MNRTYTVETRGQAVVIFGGPSVLTSVLIQEFLGKGVFAAKISSTKELEDLRVGHDPDYLVLFLDSSTNSWFKGEGSDLLPAMQSLITSGESRLITVQNLNASSIHIPLNPIAKKIHYSDYVGDSELVSEVLESWLQNIETIRTLAVPGDGLGEISLISQNDLVHLLQLAILHPSTKVGEEIYLGNPTPISLLNLAYLVRTNLPFKVNLSFDSENVVGLWPYDSSILEKDLEIINYQLMDSPEDILKKYLHSQIKNISQSIIEPKAQPKTTVVTAPAKIEKTEPKKEEDLPLKKLTPLRTIQPVFVPLQIRKPKLQISFKLPKRVVHSGPPRLRTIIGRGLIVALALYLGTIAFSTTISLLSLNRIFQTLQKGELPPTSKLNNFTTTYLQANWIALTSISGLSQKQSVKEINLLLDSYNQSLSTFSSATSLSKTAEDLTKYIFGSGDADIAKLVSLGRLQAEELYQKLSLLDGSLPQTAPSVIPAKNQAKYLDVKEKLGKLKRSVTTTKALLATTPDIIGIGGRRKYAVLFQNNMELRATGGFIGSFAILSFENGKLYDMPIYDVYDADGQLKGHVEPPKPIKDILGEANWYLRDSNFDPDFPTSARRAEWFIKKSLNQDLNGTIAVNVNTLVSLLKATGPLNIPDYNETISEGNLYERAQFHAEVNFFPGSTQKKEFLSTVANALFTKLPQLGAGEGLKLVSALSDSVQEKDTLVSLVSPTTDHIFQILGWNGQINDLPCPSSTTCNKDFVMVVDSNFGVNKANYFIRRQIEEIITFDKNLAINHILRLNYQNTSTSTAWPAGIYKNYQRVYLPIGTTIGSVKIGEKTLSPNDYVISSEHNKFVIAYLVTVPINTTLLTTIEYTTPQLSGENSPLYTWYWQKQPGTTADDNITVYLNYPMYLRPIVISPESELATQQLKFNMLNDTDHRVTVKFTK